MSNISVNTITDASGGSTASINGLTPQASNMQPHNLIINGAMQVAQRGTSAVTVTTTAGYRSVDRWKSDIDGSSGHNWSHEQSTDAPDGFDYSSKITVVTNGSQPSGTSDRHQFYYQAEAQDINSLAWGTSSAKPATLSFWVKSSVTGTYGLRFDRTTTSDTQYYNTSYVVNAGNTWEYKTVVVPAITSLPKVATGNVAGLLMEFSIGYGSGYEGSSVQDTWQTSTDIEVPSGTVYLPATSGATWQITGVQLEAGSTASSFAHENYGDTLQKCQRYYYRLLGIPDGSYYDLATAYAPSAIQGSQRHPVTMRANPAVSVSGNIRVADGASAFISSGASITNVSKTQNLSWYTNGCFTGLTTFRPYFVNGQNSTDYFEVDAEL